MPFDQGTATGEAGASLVVDVPDQVSHSASGKIDLPRAIVDVLAVLWERGTRWETNTKVGTVWRLSNSCCLLLLTTDPSNSSGMRPSVRFRQRIGHGRPGQSPLSNWGITNGARLGMQRESPGRTAFPKSARRWRPAPQFKNGDHPAKAPQVDWPARSFRGCARRQFASMLAAKGKWGFRQCIRNLECAPTWPKPDELRDRRHAWFDPNDNPEQVRC